MNDETPAPDVRQVMVESFLDHPTATLPGLIEFGSHVPDDVTDALAIVDRLLSDDRLRITLSTPPAGDVRELVDHLNGLMDSLDESVSHDQVYEQLLVAWEMARALRPDADAPPADASREAPTSLEPAAARITRALGLDPHETVADSLSISPIGEGFSVKWQGVRFLSHAEVLAALHPDREQQS